MSEILDMQNLKQISKNWDYYFKESVNGESNKLGEWLIESAICSALASLAMVGMTERKFGTEVA